MKSTLADAAHIQVGDHVRFRYWTKGEGWQFGRVIGRHLANMGVGASGLEMATVRLPGPPVIDSAIPCHLLERVTLPKAEADALDSLV